jgi:hypothetical protein
MLSTVRIGGIEAVGRLVSEALAGGVGWLPLA